MATLLVSLLQCNGFRQVYVCCGYASREVVNNDQRRVEYPEMPGPIVPTESEAEKVPNKYRLKDPPDMRSQFLLEQDARNIYNESKPARKAERLRQDERREAEQLPADPLHGMRLHAWVVLLEPLVETEETGVTAQQALAAAAAEEPDDPFATAAAEEQAANAAALVEEEQRPKWRPVFIEPSTGRSFEAADPRYLGLEYVWNHENYYVNLQEPIAEMGHTQFDFGDTTAWEHLLCGEPAEQRRENSDAAAEEELTLEMDLQSEKHLDMPASWVNELFIGQREFEERYPNRQKIVHYMRVIHERFSPYYKMNGMSERLTTYEELNYTDPLKRWEWYTNRKDMLQVITIDYKTKMLEEYFTKGRPDCLKFYSHSTIADQPRLFEFYHVPRLDALMKLDLGLGHIKQHYSARSDRLFYREFLMKAQVVKVHGPKHLMSITVKFGRNEDVASDRDISLCTFDLLANQYAVQFHYATDSITSNRRFYDKPPIPDYECEYLYRPEISTSYKCKQSDPDMSQLDQYLLMLKLIGDEKSNRTAFDEACELVRTLLATRKREMSKPRLIFNLFDPLRNNAPRLLRLAQLEAQQARAELAASSPADFLVPYLVRKTDPSHAQSVAIMNACLGDMRADCVAVLNELQRRYDEHVAEAQHFKKFLQKFHDQFDDTDYEQLCSEGEAIELNKRMIQQRLITSRQTYQAKYDRVKKSLLTDKRLWFEEPYRMEELLKCGGLGVVDEE